MKFLKELLTLDRNDFKVKKLHILVVKDQGFFMICKFPSSSNEVMISIKVLLKFFFCHVGV